MRLDALDTALLRLLLADGRLSFRELARRTGSTTPTVIARVRGLEETGLLRGVRADVDPAALPGTLFLVEAEGGADLLAAIPGAEEVLALADGRVVARVRGDEAAVARAVEASAVRAKVTPVVASPRAPPPLLANGEVAVACHQCRGPIFGIGVQVRVGGRAHAFCCEHCEATFRARFERAAKGR